jgi:hypothetical protein
VNLIIRGHWSEYEMPCWSAEQSGSAGLSSQSGDCTSRPADASRPETANVGPNAGRDLGGPPVAGLEYAIRKEAFSLMRCAVPYVPASGAELGTRRLDSSASSLLAAQSRLTFIRLSLVAVLTFTRAPNVLSGR